MCMTKTNKNMDSHLYRDVQAGNPYKILLIVIRRKMCMTKTHKNMDSHSYKDVHDENQYKNIY